MYYYGYNNYGMNTNPCCMSNPGFAGYTTGGYSWGCSFMDCTFHSISNNNRRWLDWIQQ